VGARGAAVVLRSWNERRRSGDGSRYECVRFRLVSRLPTAVPAACCRLPAALVMVHFGTYRTKYLYPQMLIDSGDGMKVRGTFIVEGIVQGVGYRELVRDHAYALNIKGNVRNLKKNEAVEVVCEGEEAVIRQLLGLIDIKTDRITVEKISERYSKPTGQFERFSIRRDLTKDGTLEILERLDTGFHMIKELDYHLTGKQGDMIGKQDIMIGKQDIMIGKQDIMIGKQDIMIGKQDLMIGKQDETIKAIKEVGTDVKAVSADVKAMDSNMNGRFDRLDAKYGEFGKTLKSVRKDTKSVASDIKVIRKEATRGRKKLVAG